MKFLNWGSKLSPLRFEPDKEKQSKKKQLTPEQSRFLAGERQGFK